jgi:hypothetical protein
MLGIPFPRPAGNSPRTRRLCDQIAPGQRLVKVQVEPAPGASVNECVPNVDAVVASRGGRRELGWALWDTFPGVLLEAEFHAVWRREDGVRVDVTPKAVPGVGHVFFLPDPQLAYDGRQIDNVRVAVVDDPHVHNFIAAAERQFEVLNRGERHRQRKVSLGPEDKAILSDVKRVQLEFHQWLARRPPAAPRRPARF